MGSNFFNDHCSPVSSNEHSAASSPYMIKPPLAASVAHKQRSSSMNSITSNHSALNSNHHNHILSSAPTPTNGRSMSIVSIESPRNSIVSIDDQLPKSWRDDSSINLNLLSSSTVPPSYGAAAHDTVDANRLRLQTSALVSDDDSELEAPTPTRHILKPIYRLKKHRPRSNDHPSDDYLERIKSDFRFKYSDSVGLRAVSPPQPPASSSHTTGSFKHLQDPSPSPLSLNNQEKSELLQDSLKQDKLDPVTTTNTKVTKKVKQTASMQRMYLKKIYSKDLQLELFQNINVSPPVSPTISYSETFNDPMTTRFAIPLSSIHPSKKLTNTMETMSEQNKAITKLNQKWNKTVYANLDRDKKKDDTKKDDTKKSEIRKRSRVLSGIDDETGDEDGSDDREDFTKDY